MNSIVARALKVGLPLTAGAAVVLFFSSGLREQILDGYLLGAGGVLLLALTRATRVATGRSAASELDARLAAMRRPPVSATEVPFDRDIELSRVSAFHLHSRVRPIMREIAAHRLRRVYGVALDAEPERARELVGPTAWELVRPGRPLPADRLGAGPPFSELRQVISELESL